jgi:hypothetical protein
MGETLFLILLFVIMAVMGLANSNYDKDKDYYKSNNLFARYSTHITLTTFPL